MCFHFKQSKTEKDFKAKGLKGRPVNGVYNGFSHPIVNVITEENPKDLQHFMWGLIPSWAKDDNIKKYTLNARHETLKTKPSFKNAKRCLIFADGFYEWKWLDKQGKKKQKYLNLKLKKFNLLLRLELKLNKKNLVVKQDYLKKKLFQYLHHQKLQHLNHIFLIQKNHLQKIFLKEQLLEN